MQLWLGCRRREIGELVRSSGFYTVKARRVKAFVESRHGAVRGRPGYDVGSRGAAELRRELLGIHGIGRRNGGLHRAVRGGEADICHR